MSRIVNGLWGGPELRVFISHTHLHKELASDLKQHLEWMGARAFVAHQDIEPTRTWLDEMRAALETMHILVALLTDDFKASNWTDQEVGYAVARAVPVVSIRIEMDPYGFMSDKQALRGSDSPKEWTLSLIRHAFEQPNLTETCILTFLNSVKSCPSYSIADLLLENVLPLVGDWSFEQEEEFAKLYNDNSQMYRSVRYRDPAFLDTLKEIATGKFALVDDKRLEWHPF